ncbi:4-amino-4-deoxy-L-arabinose transferase [Clostridia bacterium]|nr:4-amino-4-deoxy-L-arabinose transferase [Clostridia bacterium]
MIRAKKTFMVASIVFAIIAVLEMLKIGVFATMVPLDSYLNDDVRYIHGAKTLIETGIYTYFNPLKSTVVFMPGLVLTLVPFVAIFGEAGAVFAFKVFQIIFQIMSIYLVGLIAEKVFSVKVSKIAMIITAIYMPWTIMANYVYTEVIFTFLVLLLLYSTILAFERCEMKLWAVAGFVWTLAIYIRPTIVLFPVVILVMLLIEKYSWVHIAKITGLILGIFVIVMSPWWIRNYIVFDRFIPLTLGSGNPLMKGAIKPEAVDVEEYLERAEKDVRDMGEDEIASNEEEVRLAKASYKEQFEDDFLGALKQHSIVKMFEQWKSPAITQSIYIDKQNLEIIVATEEHIPIIGLAIVGMALALWNRKARRFSWLLIFVPLYFNFVYLPFNAEPRYMFPAMPCVIIFASYAGFRWYNWVMLKNDS